MDLLVLLGYAAWIVSRKKTTTRKVVAGLLFVVSFVGLLMFARAPSGMNTQTQAAAVLTVVPIIATLFF